MINIKKNILLIPVLILLTAIGIEETISFFGALFLIEIGFSSNEIGIILSLFFAGALFVIMPAGYISDRIQVRRIVSLGLFVLATSMIGMYFAKSFLINCLCWFLAGAGLRAATLALDVLYYKYLEATKRKKIVYLNIYKGTLVGLFIFGASILAGSIFLTSILVAAIVLTILAFFASFFVTSNDVFLVPTRDYISELKNPESKIFLLLAALFFFHGGGDNIALPYIWREELGFSFLEFGVLSGLAMAITVIVVQLLIIKHIENSKAIRLIAIFGFILSAVGHIIMAIFIGFNFVLFGRFIHLFGDALVTFFLTTEFAWLFSKKTTGGQYGIFILVWLISAAVSRLFVGAWATYYTYQSSLFVTAGLMLFAAFFVFVKRLEFSKR